MEVLVSPAALLCADSSSNVFSLPTFASAMMLISSRSTARTPECRRPREIASSTRLATSTI
ncbi:MAG TPA: hypothetical protein VIM48_04565 [Chthoniobacterales bacterium]